MYTHGSAIALSGIFPKTTFTSSKKKNYPPFDGINENITKMLRKYYKMYENITKFTKILAKLLQVIL